ncbi:MAG: hypothetical protein AAF086_10010, partial [Planctomycetota bacterium]
YLSTPPLQLIGQQTAKASGRVEDAVVFLGADGRHFLSVTVCDFPFARELGGNTAGRVQSRSF